MGGWKYCFDGLAHCSLKNYILYLFTFNQKSHNFSTSYNINYRHQVFPVLLLELCCSNWHYSDNIHFFNLEWTLDITWQSLIKNNLMSTKHPWNVIVIIIEVFTIQNSRIFPHMQDKRKRWIFWKSF